MQEPEAKRKKLTKEKPYTGTVQPLENCIEDSKMINKINKVFPDLKVIFENILTMDL